MAKKLIKKDPFSKSNTQSIVSHEKYQSKFDYKVYEIEDIKNELIEEEQVITSNIKRTQESLFNMAESLYKVNKKLANRKTGTYVAWCDNLGITRNKSADLLNAYNLYLETNKKEAIALPIRVVRELSKGKIENDKILEVVEAEKPSKKLEEIMLHSATKEKEEVVEAEIIEDPIKVMEERLTFLKKDISERKRNLNKIVKEAKELEEKLENINNLKLVD